MTFYIQVFFRGKDYCFRVDKTKTTREIEQYKVSGKNRAIVLQVNSPFLRSKALNEKNSSWRLVTGTAPAGGLLEAIIKELDMYSHGK